MIWKKIVPQQYSFNIDNWDTELIGGILLA